jgi:hypothetical protein
MIHNQVGPEPPANTDRSPWQTRPKSRRTWEPPANMGRNLRQRWAATPGKDGPEPPANMGRNPGKNEPKSPANMGRNPRQRGMAAPSTSRFPIYTIFSDFRTLLETPRKAAGQLRFNRLPACPVFDDVPPEPSTLYISSALPWHKTIEVNTKRKERVKP